MQGYEDVSVLCVPSMYLQPYFSQLTEWVHGKEGRFLVILEESQGLDFFPSYKGPIRSYRLTDPIGEVFTSIAWEYVFLSITLWLPDASVWEHSQVFDRSILGVHLVASETQDFYAKAIYNTCINAGRLPHLDSLARLEGFFKDVPAIICGAGPSLSGQMELLTSLASKALIFAGGASISALSSGGVPFHLAGGVDPAPDENRCIPVIASDVPFFYQTRFSSDILAQFRGIKIPVPMAHAGAFDRWFARESDETMELDGGWTVATFMTAVATFLGCSPIIFVGMDFGFTEDMYARQVCCHQKPLTGHIRQTEAGMQTKTDWIMASLWLSEWVEVHPNTCFINTSDLHSLSHARAMSLADAAQSYLHREYNMTAEVEKMIQLAGAGAGSDKPKQAGIRFEQSLHRARDYIQGMLALYEKQYPNDPSGKAEFVLFQHELEEEIFYQTVIEPVWLVWQKVFIRTRGIDLHNHLLHQILFFHKILNEHKELIASI